MFKEYEEARNLASEGLWRLKIKLIFIIIIQKTYL